MCGPSLAERALAAGETSSSIQQQSCLVLYADERVDRDAASRRPYTVAAAADVDDVCWR